MPSCWTNSPLSLSLSVYVCVWVGCRGQHTQVQTRAHTHAGSRRHTDTYFGAASAAAAAVSLYYTNVIAELVLLRAARSLADRLTAPLQVCSSHNTHKTNRHTPGGGEPGDGMPAAVPAWERGESGAPAPADSSTNTAVRRSPVGELITSYIHRSRWLLSRWKEKRQTARTPGPWSGAAHGLFLKDKAERRRKKRKQLRKRFIIFCLCALYTHSSQLSNDSLNCDCFTHHDPDLLESYFQRLEREEEKEEEDKSTKRSLLFIFNCWINTSIDPSIRWLVCIGRKRRKRLLK